MSTTKKKSNYPGNVGLVLGLVSLLLFPFVLGVAAIICGAAGVAKDEEEYNKGTSIWALVLGIVGILWALLVALGAFS